MRCTVATFGLVLLATLLSCEEEAPPEEFGDEDDELIECTPGPGSYDINGRFGVLGTLNVHVSASGLVESDATAELLLLVDFVQDGTDASLTARPCGITIPPVELAGQEPVTFDVSTELVTSVGEITATGALASLAICADLLQEDPLYILLGAQLGDPGQDPLPTLDDQGNFNACGGAPPGALCGGAAGADCACDQEGDDKVGGTLTVQNAPVFDDLNEVYVAMRSSVLLKGQVFSSDLVAGAVEATLEQTILGCQRGTDPCAAGDLRAVIAINPEITQLEDFPSTFVGKRVDAATDCEALLAMRNRLFPPG